MKTPAGVNTGIAYAIAIVAAGAVLYWLSKKAVAGVGEAAAAVGTAVNPTSQDNIANRAVEAVGSAVTGDSHWTLGGAIYDWMHADGYEDPNSPNFGNTSLFGLGG